MAAVADKPTLGEIVRLTCAELTAAKRDDELLECGPPAVALLSRDADTCLRLAYQKLHDVPYKEVGTCWRRLYTDAALWKALRMLELQLSDLRDENSSRSKARMEGEEEETGGDWVDAVIRILDMALILTGAPAREELVELWFSAIRGVLDGHDDGRQNDMVGRPQKKRKLSCGLDIVSKSTVFPATFPTAIAHPPALTKPIPRVENMSLEAFQKHIATQETQRPIIITGAIDHWPAMSERSWERPSYLLEHTLGGRRLVPVEIGKSYTDAGWGQKILSFGEFMREYMFPDTSAQVAPATKSEEQNHADSNTKEEVKRKARDKNSQNRKTGYLAQHDLLTQIPSLRADICIPDYCYSSPPPHNLAHIKPVNPLEEPLLNAWFGPAGTVSPLHTDPYHNILAQVVGYKYLRLYTPQQTPRLHPRGTEDSGVDMSNTSSVDLDTFFQLHPSLNPFQSPGNTLDAEETEDQSREFDDRFPGFKDAEFVEAVLGPGECLYVPVGWWHYVRSLTGSFSVSFWFT